MIFFPPPFAGQKQMSRPTPKYEAPKFGKAESYIYRQVAKQVASWLPEYRQERWTMVNRSLLKAHTYTMEDYIGAKFYDDHLEYAPEPYKFYIKTGSYIAGELMGQIIGFKVKGEDVEMLDKHEWRGIDDDCSPEEAEWEYFVVCVDDILESLYGVEPEDIAPDSDDLQEWIDYQLDTGKPPEGLSVWEEDYLSQKVEAWLEYQADIARGK